MPIDPSIALGFRAPQLESPVNALAQLLQVQGAQQQNQLGQMKLDEHSRGIERTNRLQALLGGFKPGTAAAEQGEILTRGGFIDEGRKVIESGAKVNSDQRAAEKAQREAEKFQIEAMSQKLALGAQILGSAKDQASYDAARQTAMNAGLDVTKMPPQFDPAFVQAKRTEGLTALQQLEQHWKAKGYDLNLKQAGETARHNKASEGLTAAGQAITVRGQNMNDARAREQLAQGKAPAGYRQGPDGTLVPIAGGPEDPKNKPATEFQGKSAAFGARAEQADKVLEGLAGKYSPAAINSKSAVESTWLVGGALGAATNKLALSDSDQRAEQAQRDFINAVLRQESGAAIGASEFDNAKKQYFPQPGDGTGVIQQKAANRKLAIQGLQTNAGRAAFSAPAAAAPAKPQQKGGLPAGWSVEVH